MASTPSIPDWIKDFRAPGFTNIWELHPSPQLYGTETLYGDWGGKVLVLLQDFSTRDTITQRIAQREPNPYRHDPTIKTNKNLVQLATPLVTGNTPTTCGILYGSALVGLLKHGKGIGADYRLTNEIRAYTRDVLRWVLGRMERLETIICGGEPAWRTTMDALGTRADFTSHRDGREPVTAGSYLISAQWHPGNRGDRSLASMIKNWRAIPGPSSEVPVVLPTSSGGCPLEADDPPAQSTVGSQSTPVSPQLPYQNLHGDRLWKSTASRKLPKEFTGIGVLVRSLVHGGGTIEELYAEMRSRHVTGWQTFSHWDSGPNMGDYNGLGMSRRYGMDLAYQGSTRRFRLVRSE